ncbi:DUF302 domain-containing protein [Sulfurimonas hydrogeniphila]|uniref:DUF302 domain-containing protein n=1 Tax=Sulfurimonas hydrogeniphila TaxID=2509341 RepID=UPI00125EDAE0|nr:DUF302 domain-containing protein [Sulfurimonas hydrogeniphila]
MIYKTQTSTPLETVKAQLEKKAKTLGFGVLGSYDFQKILKSKGFELKTPITVYELCNPPAANMALNAIAEISVYLPCRISIYEQNGKTVLATIGIEEMLNAVDVDEDFKQHMSEIFNNLRTLMSAF